MKLRYLITLGLAIGITLSACGNNSNDMSSNTPPTEKSEKLQHTTCSEHRGQSAVFRYNNCSAYKFDSDIT